MLENEELIVLRDKASTETLLDYVDYIKKEVIPNANNILNNKNAQISELKSENASLKTEMASKEKAQTDSLLTKTEIDLRAVVNDMKDALEVVKKDNGVNKSIERIENFAMKLERKIDKLKESNSIEEVKNMIESLNTKLDNNIESINNRLDNERQEIISKVENIRIPEVKQEEIKQPEEIPTSFNSFEQDLNNELENEEINKEEKSVPENTDEVVEQPSFDEFNAFDAPTFEEEAKVDEPIEETPVFETPVEDIVAPIESEATPIPEVEAVNQLTEDIAPTPTFDDSEVVETQAEVEETPAIEEVAPVEESTNAFDSILNSEENNEITEDVVKPSEDVLSSIEEAPVEFNNEEQTEDNTISEVIDTNIEDATKVEEVTPIEETPVNEEVATEGEIKVTAVEPIPEELQQEMLKQTNLNEKLTAKLTKVKRSFVNKVKEDALKIENKACDFIEMTSTMADRFLQNITPATDLQPVAITDVESAEEAKTR